MKSIEIDILVHRAIENARTDFTQSENEILRFMLGIDTRPIERRPAPRATRSSGAYSTRIDDVPIEANSLKELLRRAMLQLAKSRPGFMDTVARHETRRGRRLVARNPEALYPNSPHLASLAEKVDDVWWYDTNVSREQVLSYLRTLCDLAGLSIRPSINKRSEKTTLTAEDLDLT